MGADLKVPLFSLFSSTKSENRKTEPVLPREERGGVGERG
jgi:hypothetical protein